VATLLALRIRPARDTRAPPGRASPPPHGGTQRRDRALSARVSPPRRPWCVAGSPGLPCPIEEPDLLVADALPVVVHEEASPAARTELLDGGVEAPGEVDGEDLRAGVLDERGSVVLHQLARRAVPRAGGAAGLLEDVEDPHVARVQVFVVPV